MMGIMWYTCIKMKASSSRQLLPKLPMHMQVQLNPLKGFDTHSEKIALQTGKGVEEDVVTTVHVWQPNKPLQSS